MLKNILKLEGIEELTTKEQKNTNGGYVPKLPKCKRECTVVVDGYETGECMC
ncbi:hypothetical protein SAMN05444397_104233 [Flavobacterium aquidurense]|uniref:hypothetical protein n=1 Tax=Flavobacterium frigidimaris TaxID=262320 RepID=UPI0008989149|nr:hypothetical protein [Flavobacterium frigidimaris]SDZ22317.1 hypothetical protein SAMN05444397_104233 [Flavobacterium aquidurense]